MIKNKSNELSGDLNFIVSNYLSKICSSNSYRTDELVTKLRESLNYGEIYDIELNKHKCDFETRKEIYNRTENKELDDIYINYNNYLTNKPNQISPNLNLVQNSFNLLKNSKFSLLTSASNKLYEEKLKSFRHMKSMLGHISVQEENILNPVAIYCLCYSLDNELIFTGDNNGLIKIWSTRTGALVDIFKSHDNAVNDILLVDDYLVSCADDMSVKIWDVKKLSLIKTLNFDELIIRVISYNYKNPKTGLNHAIIIVSSTSGKIYIFDLNRIISSNEVSEYENETLLSKFYFDKKIIEKFSTLKKSKNTLQLTCIAAHPSPEILVCGFNEGTICLWDLQKILDTAIANNKFLFDFEKYLMFLEYAHDSIIQISEFDKVGKYFISASIDGNVLVWKLQEPVISRMRAGENIQEGQYPVFSQFKICENENRIRANVNAATWSTHNNYIIAMISSRKKKRIATQIAERDRESDNSSCYKRSSAIIIYDVAANSLIRRYDSSNNFPFHDECYVLESHPIHEEIILTVINTNEIVIFNFLSGKVLCRFTEENYFFSSQPQSLIACEGKFSNNGDNFVISTYYGSISIYSIYSKNSYSTTYMNQFFDEEFTVNDEPFKKYVNMHNLPYITQQPVSGYKLKQMERSIFPKIRNNYSMKEIERKLLNNYQFYDKNNLDREFECEREENMYRLAAKENLGYIIADNENLDPEEESALTDNNSEYQAELRNEDDISELVYDEVLEEVEREDEEIIDSVSHEDCSAVYNLRSRRRNAAGDDVIDSNSNGSVIPTLNTNQREQRWTLRNRNRSNQSNSNITSNVNSDVIENFSNRRVRKRLGRRGRPRINSEPQVDDNENENGIGNENAQNEDENCINYQVPDSIQMFGDDVAKMYLNCVYVRTFCFLCLTNSSNLIGPFELENLNEHEIEHWKSLVVDNKIYCHPDCLLTLNDFTNEPAFNSIKTNNIDSHITSELKMLNIIQSIVKANIGCNRCGTKYASKKCSNKNCHRYYHVGNCINSSCVSENNELNCLKCYRDNQQMKFKENNKKSLQINLNSISRDFFLKEDFSFYTFFPQLGRKIYFILLPYLDFLIKNYQKVINELDDNENIFFWEDSSNYKQPILCEITQMEYLLPNEHTIKQHRGKINTLQIMIKIKIKPIKFKDLKEFSIIFFENDSPDFFVDEQLFEKNYQLYLEMKKTVDDGERCETEIVISDVPYSAELIKIEQKQIGLNFIDSYFETMIFRYLIEDKEIMRVSFWDLYQSELKMNSWLTKSQSNILNHIEDVVKNNPKFSLFMDMVDEVKDCAQDYYNIIPVPMFLNLIKNRLKNNFYSSLESIQFDLRQIEINASLYNGADSKIAKSATIMVRSIINFIAKLKEESPNLMTSINDNKKSNRLLREIEMTIKPDLSANSKRTRSKPEFNSNSKSISNSNTKATISSRKNFNCDLNEELSDDGHEEIEKNNSLDYSDSNHKNYCLRRKRLRQLEPNFDYSKIKILMN